MTQIQRYRYPLHLPHSLRATVTRLAQEDGVSLKQWIVGAVAQKIGALETARDVLNARAVHSHCGDLTRWLDKAPDVPAMPGDEIDA